MTETDRKPAVHVRPATPDDRSFVLEMADRLTAFDLPPWRPPEQVVQGDRRDLAKWFDEPGRSGECMLIADIDGMRAGVAHLVTASDFFTLRAHGHLSVLAVAVEAEGRGVGSALLDASAEWARQQGFDRLTLSVFAGNQRAQRVYERHGFAPEFLRYTKPL